MLNDHLYKMEQISNHLVIIFCATYINPISCLPSIERELSERSFSGTVLFDLLLSNGFSSNRFFQVEIKEGKIDRRYIKVVDVASLDGKIIERVNLFYKRNVDLLRNNHILLDEEKEFLLC